MEYLDTYTEDGQFLGPKPRKEVHAKGLWHKTVHCWLVQKPGNIIFQMRSLSLPDNPGKLYTTASGHLSAGETLETGMQREVNEELGVSLDTSKANLIRQGKYMIDFVKTDGSEYHDRVFVSIYLLEDNRPLMDYNFDTAELHGLFSLNIREALKVIKSGNGKIKSQAVIMENGIKCLKETEIDYSDFLVVKGENAYTKYGFVLEAAIHHFEDANVKQKQKVGAV